MRLICGQREPDAPDGAEKGIVSMTTYKPGISELPWPKLQVLYGARADLRAAFENSRRVVTARDGQTLVGAARRLGDNIYVMAADVEVAPGPADHQLRKGLLEALLEGGDALRVYSTAPVPEAEPAYRALGFRRHKTGYVLPPGVPRPTAGATTLCVHGTDAIEWSQLNALYDEVGLVGGLAAQKRYQEIRDAFLTSQRVVTAWQGNRLVGAARMLGDRARYGLVVDVGVREQLQGQGIGRQLMAQLLRNSEGLSIWLTSTLDFQPFYQRLGFVKQPDLLARFPGVTGPSEYLE